MGCSHQRAPRRFVWEPIRERQLPGDAFLETQQKKVYLQWLGKAALDGCIPELILLGFPIAVRSVVRCFFLTDKEFQNGLICGLMVGFRVVLAHSATSFR